MARAARSASRRLPPCPFTVTIDRRECSRPHYYALQFRVGSGRLSKVICRKGGATLNATSRFFGRLFGCRVPR